MFGRANALTKQSPKFQTTPVYPADSRPTCLHRSICVVLFSKLPRRVALEFLRRQTRIKATVIGARNIILAPTAEMMGARILFRSWINRTLHTFSNDFPYPGGVRESLVGSKKTDAYPAYRGDKSPDIPSMTTVLGEPNKATSPRPNQGKQAVPKSPLANISRSGFRSPGHALHKRGFTATKWTPVHRSAARNEERPSCRG